MSSKEIPVMHTPFPRQLANETLDMLAEDDPRAIRSRQDLQRINRIMGSAGIITRALSHTDAAPERILELGAGDGSLMLRIARSMAPRWPNVRVTLLDRQDLLDDRTHRGFERLGWTIETMRMDVLDWIAQPTTAHWNVGIANLFIHHFESVQIERLFSALRERVDLFVACEPRRSRLPLLASRLVGLIGANEVTREDAVLSVQAGFYGNELSSLWQANGAGWELTETSTQLFSHLFVTHRQAA